LATNLKMSGISIYPYGVMGNFSNSGCAVSH
jgi:hypothetical protein